MLKIGIDNENQAKQNLLSKFKIKRKETIPELEKPLLSYMYMYDDPRHDEMGGMFSVFKSLFETKSEVKEETKSEYKTEYKSEVKTEVKSEVKYEVKQEIKTKVEIKPEIKFKTKVKHKPKYKPQTPYQSLIFTKYISAFKEPEPPKNPIKETFQNAIDTLIDATKSIYEHLKDAKSSINNKVYEISQNIEDTKELIIDNLCEKISAKKSQAYLNFAKKLSDYEDLFSLNDECPDISHFENYENLSIPKLLLLEKQLDIWTAHQKGIIALKERYNQNFKTMLNYDDVDKLFNCNLKKMGTYNPRHVNKSEALEECCKIFLENSENVQESIKAFKNTSKDLFGLCKNIIEDIFELQNNQWYKKLERIPLMGTIPKSIRIIDQINLTRCLKGNYKEFTNDYVKKGMHNTILHYENQYKYIKSLADNYPSQEDKEKENYINMLLQKIQKVKNNQIKSYSNLFNNYSKIGCYINGISNKVRTKGIIYFVRKATLAMI